MALHEISIDRWNADVAADAVSDDAVQTALERGDVLCLPSLRFAIEPEESPLFTPTILTGAKNASFDPRTDRLGGTTLEGAHAELLRGLMRRFS